MFTIHIHFQFSNQKRADQEGTNKYLVVFGQDYFSLFYQYPKLSLIPILHGRDLRQLQLM